MTKKLTGLGKGLDAIFQDAGVQSLNAHKSNDTTVSEIELSKIVPNPNQPRTLFAEEALEELAQSIRQLGIIQPITVREEGGKYLIISGERRFRASQIAGLVSIPAYVRKANDQQLLEMALVENIQREELNAIEIALTFERLLEDCKLTQKELSERVGKKRSTIANYVRLLSLAAQVQAALKAGIISMGHARAIAGVENHTDQIYLLEQIVEGKLSVHDAEELVAKMNEPNEKASKKTTKNPYKELAKALTKSVGFKVAISSKGNGVGKVAIEFNSEEQLQKIQTLLGK